MWAIIIAVILTLVVTSIWNPEKKRKAKSSAGRQPNIDTMRQMQAKYKQVIMFLEPNLNYEVLKNTPRHLIIHFNQGNTEFKLEFKETDNLVNIYLHSIARGNGFEIFNIKLNWQFNNNDSQTKMTQEMQYDMEREMEKVLKGYDDLL